MRALSVVILFPILAQVCQAQRAEPLDFLAGHTDFRDARQMLRNWLRSKAEAALDARRIEIDKLNSAASASERKRYVRERMLRALGTFPERTPLNARVVGTIERDDHKIEKIIFESQPGLHVTANLYLPNRGQAPYPAVLFPLGHEEGAKAHGTWQQMLVSLAKKGYVALAWDPIGQGERVQMFDEALGTSKVVRSTTEHTLVGLQCLLTGDNLARYTIWDGMRALDYLLSRKEVNPKLVAVTGNSGGGTHTAYLAALDDRIQVAAPSCYLTSWRRLLATIGPQDAEQCLPPWLGDGLDHADFIYAMAPKPYLMLSAIRDFFSITGARETFLEAKRVYEAQGVADALHMVEADDGHGYTKPRRMAAYRWFARWLKQSEDTEPEPEAPIAGEEELWCTKTGQVSTSLGGETVFTLNRSRAQKMASNRRAPSQDEIRRRIGFEAPKAELNVRSFGTVSGAGYRVEKLVYQSEPGIDIPSLLFLPDSGPARKPASIFVDGRGKSAARSDIEQLVRGGLVVLSIDARGFGETQQQNAEYGSDWPRYFGDYYAAMTAMLLGKSLVGGRALDIIRGVEVLVSRAEVDASQIAGFAREGGGIPLLHAAALDKRLRKVAVERSLGSYESVVTQPLHRRVAEQVIPGVLQSYDLPDLAASLGRPVWIVDALDPVGQLLPLDRARSAYARAGNQVRIVRRAPEQAAAALYQDFF